MAVTTFISDRFKGLPPQLLSGALGPRRRRMSLTFIPPSTQSPLFVYGQGDQRSFLSLTHELVVRDDATVSTSRSLPSTLSSAGDDTWLLEEHQRYTESLQHLTEESLHSAGTSEAKSTTPVAELTILATYSFPLILTFVLQQAFSLVSVLVVGRLGKAELAAVSLASMTSTITLAVFEGISTSLDTLCPQAYGAGNFHAVGVHFQRCTLFSLFFYGPVALMWWFSGSFLSLVIDDVEVVRLLVLFLRWMILAGPAFIIFENGKRFLQAQGIFEAGTGILVLSAPVNVALSILLVHHTPLGFSGAPLALACSYWLQCALLYLYIAFVNGDKCWGGLSRSSITHWWDLAELAVPGIIMLEAEYLAYEILTLLSSRFGTPALAAQSAISTIASVTYMVPFAVSIAGSTRIGAFVGAGNVPAAMIATRVTLCVGLSAAVANCVLLFAFKKSIAQWFTHDSEVVRLIQGLFPLVAMIQVADGVASVASGILRAQGRQKVGGIVNLVGYYVVGLPVGAALAWGGGLLGEGWGLEGLWCGLGAGMLGIGVVESWWVLGDEADWEEVVERANDRLA